MTTVHWRGGQHQDQAIPEKSRSIFLAAEWVSRREDKVLIVVCWSLTQKDNPDWKEQTEAKTYSKDFIVHWRTLSVLADKQRRCYGLPDYRCPTSTWSWRPKDFSETFSCCRDAGRTLWSSTQVWRRHCPPCCPIISPSSISLITAECHEPPNHLWPLLEIWESCDFSHFY